jgi:hypothetical protein
MRNQETKPRPSTLPLQLGFIGPSKRRVDAVTAQWLAELGDDPVTQPLLVEPRASGSPRDGNAAVGGRNAERRRFEASTARAALSVTHARYSLALRRARATAPGPKRAAAFASARLVLQTAVALRGSVAAFDREARDAESDGSPLNGSQPEGQRVGPRAA